MCMFLFSSRLEDYDQEMVELRAEVQRTHSVSYTLSST